ncbi:Panacea domain-containing protein [Celeribacter sp.]|uniref:Panacea domain-containing protein n=1 Tax=Celeribacter sp. TaxID=1890673 RepID=UPI003A8CBACA
MHDARQIANWYVRRAAEDGRTLSIMQLLKLIYIAHGWHLEMFKRPLFSNRIEAWKFGPVVPEVYAAFRSQGVNVKRSVPVANAALDDNQKKLLDEVYSIYGPMDAFRLSDITHVANGPWALASRKGYFAEIPNEQIQAHYEKLRETAKSAQAAS